MTASINHKYQMETATTFVGYQYAPTVEMAETLFRERFPEYDEVEIFAYRLKREHWKLPPGQRLA